MIRLHNFDEIRHAFTLCQTEEEVLWECFHYVGQAVNNQNISMHLWDETFQTYRPAKMHKESSWTEEDWIKVLLKVQLNYEKDKLFQEIFHTKTIIYIPNVALDDRPNREACREFGINGLFMLPIVADQKVIAVLAAVSMGELLSLTTEQINCAITIAELASEVIEKITEER